MMRYKNVLLLYNGAAGNGDIAETLQQVTRRLAPDIVELTLYQTQKEGDATRISTERGKELDLLIIMGGDGTVHESINGIMQLEPEYRPTVAILPTGTCNDFSRALDNHTIEEALEAILEGRTISVDIGQMNDHYFSNFVGLGLITEASKSKEGNLKDRFGKFGYLLSAVQSLKNPEPFSYTLTTDKETKSGEAIMILAMNGHYLGTAGLFLEKTLLTDALLDLFIVQEAGMTLVKNVYNQTFADENGRREAEGLEVFQAGRFTLETDPSLDVDSDGEIYVNTPLEITVHPEAIAFIKGWEEG
ncbi:diacylglycerol/lipid kinase family protein [Shouchella shacheensis]|uniref:diacylglycerol/lipid kinase family protein n=1 Tax=Shouchella shacheensis TaxID=1649580 RepID=UPI000740137B|nr:diacylglycerol kinase family protein [Shouchella shacheensis]